MSAIKSYQTQYGCQANKSYSKGTKVQFLDCFICRHSKSERLIFLLQEIFDVGYEKLLGGGGGGEMPLFFLS